jgi:lipopolysaccharide/colanic/teichoic acid biosynthesis glycosyltransferase
MTRWQTRKSDGKHSRFGLWLESWEGHRLPELWSVVTSKIRLVGVKPLSPKDAGIIQENWSQRRYEYPAGITGRWYTDLPTDSDLGETLVADVHYIRTRRFLHDCAILWRTPFAWWRHMRRTPEPVAEWSGNRAESGKAKIF